MDPTQQNLQDLDDGQLEQLRARCEGELDRRLQERVDRDARESSGNSGSGGSGRSGGHIRMEMIRCNNCRKCSAGLRPHGPYWYSYIWSGGRLQGDYLGKSIPARAAGISPYPVGSKPEDVDPAGVARVHADVARQWAAIVEAEQTGQTPAAAEQEAPATPEEAPARRPAGV